MARDELTLMVNLDQLGFGLDPDAFSGQSVRYRVAVGFESNQAVLGDMPDGALLDDIRRSSLGGMKKIFFLKEHLRGFPMSRPVDSLVGHRHDPLQKTRVEMIEALERLSPEEPLDVLDPRLNFALRLRPVGSVRPRLEAVIPAKIPEHGVPLEARALEVPSQDDRLEVVIDDLVGNAAEMQERGLVPVEEGRQPLITRRDGVHPSASEAGGSIIQANKVILIFDS